MESNQPTPTRASEIATKAKAVATKIVYDYSPRFGTTAEGRAFLIDYIEEEFTSALTAYAGEKEKAENERDMYIQKLEQATTQAQEFVLQNLDLKSRLTAAESKVEKMGEKFNELMMSADCSWYENNQGHDWCAAVDSFRTFLQSVKEK